MPNEYIPDLKKFHLLLPGLNLNLPVVNSCLCLIIVDKKMHVIVK